MDISPQDHQVPVVQLVPLVLLVHQVSRDNEEQMESPVLRVIQVYVDLLAPLALQGRTEMRECLVTQVPLDLPDLLEMLEAQEGLECQE